ncbi:uncharacterized protein L201_001257 [Kwoniella dendrophila CBS 6074]|uniref:Tethering factor for nuclear proteasome STS1 n=1 Tax=Kwoniella dendrophila CBS 6074 TaxID=1295534 RepID=A0AAX4JLT9_9TREE
MAHPLTQQPPSSLPFAFAARPSPLAFGFGLPATHSAFSTPHRTPAGISWSSPGQSPTKASLSRSRSDFRTVTPSSNLKRSRRSRSPSSSPPLSPKSPASASSYNQTSKVDLSAVAGLDLQDGSSKSTKRSKLAPVERSQAAGNEIDAGILLATLPPSAHLTILLNLLRTHPSLSEAVLAQIPQPEVKTCVREIQTAFDAIQKAAGGRLGVRGGSEISDSRRWVHVRHEVEVFCRTASTYIRYFTLTTQPPLGTESIFTFLQPLTFYLQALLQNVPANAPATNAVLELAKLVLSIWTRWLDFLAVEVNQRGGMYPHSAVTHWAEVLDRLVAKDQPFSNSAQHWSLSSSQPTVSENSVAFDESFRQALLPVRDRFVKEMGWMIGHRA